MRAIAAMGRSYARNSTRSRCFVGAIAFRGDAKPVTGKDDTS